MLFQLAWNCCRHHKCHDFVCRWSLHESFWYGYCSGTVLLSGRLYCAQVMSRITVFSTKFPPSTWQDSDVFHTQLSGTAFLVCVSCLSIHQEDTFLLSQQSHEWLFQYIIYITYSSLVTIQSSTWWFTLVTAIHRAFNMNIVTNILYHDTVIPEYCNWCISALPTPTAMRNFDIFLPHRMFE